VKLTPSQSHDYISVTGLSACGFVEKTSANLYPRTCEQPLPTLAAGLRPAASNLHPPPEKRNRNLRMTSMRTAGRPGSLISAILAARVAPLASFILVLGIATDVFARDEADLLIARTPARTPQEEQRMFHLPPGFRIDLVAKEPDIIKPINMKFDSAGRLYVTQSIEYPFPVPEGHKGRDTIRRIVDRDRDGVPDTVSVFADGLCIPIGVTPIAGGVFGYSIPHLYRFYDKNNDGFAETREIAYSGFGHRDTHGMVNNLNYWIDGWIYCCHGFSNTSTVKGTDGSAITMQSGNTFRVRIDGSHVEQFSFGQVNPFGMTFDPRGDVYTADCHSRPAMLLLRGGCYQSFGKPHDGLGFAPEIMQHGHGSTGIAGIVIYNAEQFPEPYRGTIFLGNPVTGIINHDRLKTTGSTQTAVELPDFMTCDDPWFRPVDLQLAADGSIYVADFYNCIIGHYEVPLTHPLRDKTRGRIWRISYTGAADRLATPRKPSDLSRAPLETLVASLGDANALVRRHATHELVNRIGKPAIEPVRALVESSASPEGRSHAVWVLFRLGALDRELAARLGHDPASLVRLHTVKALGEDARWDVWQRPLVMQKLSDADPFVRRSAADVLGVHPDLVNIDPLAQLWRTADPSDTMLIQVARIALRNTVRSLPDPQLLARRYRTSEDMQRRLIDVCFGIHTPQAAALVLALEQDRPFISPHPVESLRYVATTIDAARMPDVDRLALAYRSKGRELQSRILSSLLRANRERGAPIPQDVKAWSAQVIDAFLGDANAGRVRRGIELAAEAGLPSSAAKLAPLVSGTRFPQLRGPAAEALVRVNAEKALPVIEDVVRNSQTPLAVRCDAAEALRSVNSAASRAFLVSLLQLAPGQLAAAIVDTLARSREGAAVLIDAVEKGHCSARLLGDPGLRGRLQAVGVPQLEARLAKVLEGLPTADERINKTIAARAAAFAKTSPNADRGVGVFQKNCAACHQIAGKGNRVGPQLDGVGNRGVDRILEDVLDPNRNVDANFRATILALGDGQIVNGLIVREEGPILVLVDNKGKEQRIPSGTVEQRTQSKLSPMPANVSDLLSPQELYDLLAYLLKQRAPGEANR
jgi:putative heme-binding domain-containing protein